MQISRTTKFTGVCVGVYMSYVLFIFYLLPILMPDPVTLQRSVLAYKTRHLGELSNFTLETGGQPIRSMLVTFRGSGALTLLDNLAHQPGCYQHYAPLIAYESRSTSELEQGRALDELEALYNCNYNKSEKMILNGMRSPVFRRFYGAQYKICLTYSQEICWDRETMAAICKLHPFINMAVYNMRLKYLATLLERQELNLRILLMVRDPRGTIYSRLSNNWCTTEKDCEAEALCSDMVSDYQVVETLTKFYPHRFSIIRYEDLVLHPEESIKLVFDFYGLPLRQPKTSIRGIHPRSGQGVESIGVDLRLNYNNQPAYDWMSKMKVNDIKAVQKVCGEAMDLWGYHSVQDFKNFSPETFEPIMGKTIG
ncbi:carbohydrate sulfotransferase 1 [Drosophila eugracilis]|uniref:carbohydrate sulfotransferase 1 n=1 Tax=Drosophila eugracilis TaxID=29029 RepID=UPI001BD9CB5F|nr:carbohydrate sulfotransferase 1 [Drosophila eugracilis]